MHAVPAQNWRARVRPFVRLRNELEFHESVDDLCSSVPSTVPRQDIIALRSVSPLVFSILLRART